jgi:hypothetical protein
MLNENEQSSLILINSSFEKNFAQGDGGVMKLINVLVAITNSTFSGNEANIGGVISFECNQNSSLCGLEARSNIFKNNKGNMIYNFTSILIIFNPANYQGGVIFWFFKSPKFDVSNVFENNQAFYGPEMATFPVRILPYNNESKSFANSTTFAYL